MKCLIKKIPIWHKITIILFVMIFLILFVGGGYDRLEIFLAKTFPSDQIFVAKTISVSKTIQDVNGVESWTQTVDVKFLTGPSEGQAATTHVRGQVGEEPGREMKVGETVLVAKNNDMEGDEYYIADRYRLASLLLLTLIFVGAAILFGRIRGLSSLLGLVASIAILIWFVVPQILSGADPLVVSFVGSIAIAIVSLYLAHGFSRKTSIALLGTLITLSIAVLITLIFTSVAHLLGFSGEESFYLQLKISTISLKGILLGGIIIGMLGVLDDVTMGQVATVYEIKEANSSLGVAELYKRGTAVGREHIASLVNTLVLAYAGASFPLFLLLIAQNSTVPIWQSVNGEPIAEEIVRTLVGSLALVFAVPITTFLAAYYYGNRKNL